MLAKDKTAKNDVFFYRLTSKAIDKIANLISSLPNSIFFGRQQKKKRTDEICETNLIKIFLYETRFEIATREKLTPTHAKTNKLTF